MRIRHAVGFLAYAAVTVTGCTAAENTVATESTQPDTRQAASQSASTSDDLPEVTFNPCDEIDDAFLVRFDLDPAKRDRHEFSIGREDIYACGNQGNNWSVSVIAQNTPWDDIPFHATPQTLTVNGREALQEPGGLSDDSCSLLMRTDFGAVIVEQMPLRGGDTDPSIDRCDRIVEIAEAVEPLIDN